ncbi:MAG: hypothetical protein WBY53_02675 [Acidobacteriaceae bacterium]
MKRVLQFVVLVVTLSLAAQPVIAEGACGQQTCGHHQTMDCCRHQHASNERNSMPMGMHCGDTQPSSSARKYCTSDTCCATLPLAALAVVSPGNAWSIASPATILAPVAVAQPASLAAPDPPGLHPRSSPRYLLFHVFRI